MLQDRYALLSVIGSGGVGKVYLARDIKLDKLWAIKEIPLLDERMREVCDFEIKILKSLSHQALPRIVDVCRTKDFVYIVMDYLKGISLKQLVDSKGGLSDEQIIEIGIKLSEVMIYLHGGQRNITYRDMKPSNVMMCEDGRICLVDFGGCIGPNLTGVRYAIGTRRYASPEVLKGKRADEKSDIYGIGKTLEYCLAGRPPGHKLFFVLEKCLKEDPSERYKNSRQLMAALEKATRKKMDVKWPIVAIVVAGLFLMLIMTSVSQGEKRHKYVSVSGNSGLFENSELSANSELSENGAQAFTPFSSSDNEDYIWTKMNEASELFASVSERLSGDNYDEKSLLLASEKLMEEKELLGTLEMYETIDCLKAQNLTGLKAQNLSMLSTIYRLLGKKRPEEMKEYYLKSMSFIDELFSLEGFSDSKLYRLKLSDVVSMKEELGDKEGAIKELVEWEKNNPDGGKDLLFEHMSLLLSDEGNEKEVKELYERMQKIDEATEDFRYETIERQILDYLRD